MSNFLDETGVSWIFNKIKTNFVSSADVVNTTAVSVDPSPTSGSTGLVTSGGVYSALNPAIQTTAPSTGMLPNVIYNFGTLTAGGTYTFTLDNVNITSGLNHYFWMFDVGSGTVPVVNFPSNLTWSHGSEPAIAVNNHYEISVINGIAVASKVYI